MVARHTTALAILSALIACDALSEERRVPMGIDRSDTQHMYGETTTAGRIPQFPEMVEQIRQVTIDFDGAYWLSVDDHTLERGVNLAGGKVHIGLKSPNAPLSRTTSVISGVSRADALAYQNELVMLGVKLIRSYRNSATVAAVVDPKLAPTLRRLPFIDFVEPIPHIGLAAQDTTWGMQEIGVPTAWGAGFKGSGMVSLPVKLTLHS